MDDAYGEPPLPSA